MGKVPTLYIFPTADDEGRFWAERLMGSVPERSAIFVRLSNRSNTLMSLVRSWEELACGRADYWIGSLWDIPVVRRFLKSFREVPQIDVLREITETEVPSCEIPLYRERDQEAIRCLSLLVEPSHEILSLESWRELTEVCRTTEIEVGALPWPLSIVTEQSFEYEDFDNIWIPQFRESPETPWPGWLEEKKNIIASAALMDDRGVSESPDYETAKKFSWSIKKYTSDKKEERSDLHDGNRSFHLRHPKRLKSWHDKIRDHVFSVTELETYVRSPYWYFCEWVLGLKPLKKETWDLEAAEVGILIHAVLEEFYRKHQSELVKLQQEILFDDLDRIIEREVAKFRGRRPELFNLLVERHLRKMKRALHNLINKDLADRASEQSPLYPQYFEWGFGDDKTQPLLIRSNNGKEIQVRGRIDRIDVDPVNKTFLVIDYKTGTRKITGSNIEKGESLQLPLHIAAVKQLLLPDFTPIGGVYFSLADMTKEQGMLNQGYVGNYFRLSPRSSSLMSPDRWQIAMNTALERVREIVEQIYGAQFPHKETQCATFCPYRDMCRINERFTG